MEVREKERPEKEDSGREEEEAGSVCARERPFQRR